MPARHRDPLVYFRHVLLASLAACGGSVATLPPDPADAGKNGCDPAEEPASCPGGAAPQCVGGQWTCEVLPQPDAGPEPDTGVPVNGCNWTSGPQTPCTWTTYFPGDPALCINPNQSTQEQCATLCGVNSNGEAVDRCYVVTGDAVDCYVDNDPSCGMPTPTPNPGNGGRRTSYFAALGFGPAPRGRELGVHFARVACMEAGSVDAFRMLKDELVAHGAPRRLIRATERAIRDERRHVRQTAALARRFGEEPVSPRPLTPRTRRSFEEIVLENAVEGCVRETYSALECVWQAEVATDPVVRATMTRIARDEMRHLALSWAVHAWAIGRLDPAARARVRDAQGVEIAEMLEELARDPHESLQREGGLPRAAQSRALVTAIAERLAA